MDLYSAFPFLVSDFHRDPTFGPHPTPPNCEPSTILRKLVLQFSLRCRRLSRFQSPQFPDITSRMQLFISFSSGAPVKSIIKSTRSLFPNLVLSRVLSPSISLISLRALPIISLYLRLYLGHLSLPNSLSFRPPSISIIRSSLILNYSISHKSRSIFLLPIIS